jgi:catechol 2,3-dioxygenase-like lactoylglutathione lyase family enzyme
MTKAQATSAEPASFRTAGNVAIHVPDLAKAEASYSGVLRFRLVHRTPDKLEFDTGALRLFVNRDPDALMLFIPALEVADYETPKRHLEKAGCRITREWPGGKAVYFQDPFGLVLDIIERHPTVSPG